jgi:hypothetical protein
MRIPPSLRNDCATARAKSPAAIPDGSRLSESEPCGERRRGFLNLKQCIYREISRYPAGQRKLSFSKAKVYQLALRLSRKPALIAMIEKCQFSANKTAVKVPIVPINGTFRCSSMNLGAYNPNTCRACIHAVLQQFQSGDPNGVRTRYAGCL